MLGPFVVLGVVSEIPSRRVVDSDLERFGEREAGLLEEGTPEFTFLGCVGGSDYLRLAG